MNTNGSECSGRREMVDTHKLDYLGDYLKNLSALPSNHKGRDERIERVCDAIEVELGVGKGKE